MGIGFLIVAIIWLIIEKLKPVKQRPIKRYDTKPKPFDAIVDVRGYEYDVKKYGQRFADDMKRIGKYNQIRRNLYDYDSDK